MVITEIRIRNFRSLRDVTVDANDLTVLVGCNDEGKSNILRAIDLFFNGGADGGYKLNWDRDFCALAKPQNRKAPQIEVKLVFRLPSSYNLASNVVWEKVWREAGLHRDDIRLTSGEDLPSRSKASAFLRSIRYEYVPAIKGPDYFERLLASVHDMLDGTVRSQLRNAATDFTATIREHTSGILADLQEQLGLTSEIEMPNDLRRLFSELEFRSDAGSHRVALSQRGDGVKVRHIPIILRWLAIQANHLSAAGKPRIATIWGYEEPENNLEIKRCFELADFFLATSQSIQTFLTTHSPVYYSVFSNAANSSNVNVAEVRLDQSVGTSVTPRRLGDATDVDALHSSIGFLDLLEPHVKEWKEKADQLTKRLEEGLDLQHPTIFVEGPTDQIILSAAIRRFFPDRKVKILFAQVNGGGHAWVKDSLIAWQHSRGSCRAVGLFDDDDGSKQSLDEFKLVVEDRVKKPRAFKHRMKPDGLALELAKLRFKVPLAIEELCPKEAWQMAESKNYLELRPKLPELYCFSETDVTFNAWIEDKIPDPDLLLVAKYRVKVEEKERFAKYIAKQLGENECQFDFEPLRQLTESLLEKLKTLET